MLHGSWGFSLVDVQGEGWQELSSLSLLSHLGPLLHWRAWSQVRVSWGRSRAVLLVPAGMGCPCPCCQAGGRPADRSEEQCQTGWKQVQQQEVYPGRRK